VTLKGIVSEVCNY